MNSPKPVSNRLKVALVHDYLVDFGGAERVLMALSEIWPDAPIYTAFYQIGSPAHERFKNKRLIPSWAQKIPGFVPYLHSPLRFLAPEIWESFDFDDFDIVVSSASWYITKGIITRPETLHICYCHTPPHYLYGLPTSVQWQRYWLKKYYERGSTVIYPPVDLPRYPLTATSYQPEKKYYLTISRIVGGKGLQLAIEAANQLHFPLKVVGAPAGWSQEKARLETLAGKTVEFVGYVDDQQLAKLYAGAKAFLALAEDEDFGITPVEAMLAGTPVIAYRGGGYLETIIDGKTGLFFNQLNSDSLIKTIKKFETMKFDKKVCQQQAQKFSKTIFQKKISAFISTKLEEHQKKYA